MTEALRPELITIVPSRGRPHTVDPLARAFADTSTGDTSLVIVVDDDDPRADDYAEQVELASGTYEQITLWINHGTKTMVAALNAAAAALLADNVGTEAVAFMGDDHRPRTRHWDQAYLNTLDELGTGIVYGNDLFQGERIPTQVAMTADIPLTLGHMAPPPLTHLFVDNYWHDLGTAAGCLRYLRHVVVEHLHPFAGKTQWDAGYMRVNTSKMYARDMDAYRSYAAANLAADVTKVQALR